MIPCSESRPPVRIFPNTNVIVFLNWVKRNQFYLILSIKGTSIQQLEFERKTLHESRYRILSILSSKYINTEVNCIGCVILIGQVRYPDTLHDSETFREKNAIFSSFFCSSIPKRGSDTKKTTPNIDICNEKLGAILEYCYIERDLLKRSIGILLASIISCLLPMLC